MGAINPPLELGEGDRRVGVTSLRWQWGQGDLGWEKLCFDSEGSHPRTKVQVMYLE